MQQEEQEAIDDDHVVDIEGDIHRIRHYPQIQGKLAVLWLEKKDMKAPCGVNVGDGPKRSANRGWNDCDGKFLDEKQNRRVLFPRDIVHHPNRHNPDHGFLE